MDKAILVQSGESKVDKDLLLEIVSRHTESDQVVQIRSGGVYCFIEHLDYRVNHETLIEDIEKLGMTVWIALEPGHNGHDEVIFMKSDVSEEEVWKHYNGAVEATHSAITVQ